MRFRSLARVSLAFIFIVSLFTHPIVSQAQSEGAVSRPPLAVFLIHGLLGSEATFGEFGKALQSMYGERMHVKAPTYPTLNSKLKASDFSEIIYMKIIHYLVENGFTPESDFSLIVHSQGGQVAYKYHQSCYVYPNRCSYENGLKALIESKAETKNPELAAYGQNLEAKLEFERKLKANVKRRNLRHILTFGTPFWGAPTANRLKDSVLPKAGKLVGITHPKAQLSALSSGSTTVYSIRKNMARFSPAEGGKWKNPFEDSGVQIVNVGGDTSELDDSWLFKVVGSLKSLLTFSWVDRETDVAVDIPNSRLDFIYHVEDEPGAQPHVGFTRAASAFYAVKKPHISFLLSNGMAEVVGADHLALSIASSVFDEYFRSHDLTAVSVPAAANPIIEAALAKDVVTFSVDLKVRPPLGYQRLLPLGRPGAIRVRGDSGVFDTLHLAGTLLNKYVGSNSDGEANLSKNYHAYYHQGHFRKQFAFRPKADFSRSFDDTPLYGLSYEIHVPGWKRRQFVLSVSPSFSTYAEIYLEPFIPFAPGKTSESGTTPLAAFHGKHLRRHQGDSAGVRVISLGAEQALRAEERAEHEIPNAADINKCYVARVAQHRGVHKGEVFDSFGSPRAVKSLAEGQLVHVIGRYRKGYVGREIGETDRYLVLPAAGSLLDSLVSERARARFQAALAGRQLMKGGKYASLEARREGWKLQSDVLREVRSDPTARMAWMNLVDLDVLEDQRCDSAI